MSILRYRQLKSEIYAKHDDVIFKLLHCQFFKYEVQVHSCRDRIVVVGVTFT